MPESVFTQTIPALFAGGACWAVAVLEAGALEGAAAAGAAAGLVTGAVDAAGVGVAVFDFAGVAAGAVAVGAVDAVAGAVVPVADFFERVFFEVVLSAVAVPDAGAA